MMGSGGLVVMNDSTCMVDTARFFTDFSVDESCGKCVPCRVGMKLMLNILNRIAAGKGSDGGHRPPGAARPDISRRVPTADSGRALPTLSSPRSGTSERNMRPTFRRNGALPWSARTDPFRVNADKCKMCGLCKKACPTEAITWEKKTPAVINPDEVHPVPVVHPGVHVLGD